MPRKSPRFVCLRMARFPAWAMWHSGAITDDEVRPDDGTFAKAGTFAILERHRILAPSPEARRVGVTVGMTSGRAMALCEGLQLLPRDRSREVLASGEIERALYGLTPLVEPLGDGVFFCAAPPGQLAPLLRVWSGDGIWHVTAGAAGDRATATLAALSAPPGRCRVVKPGAESSFVANMPLSQLASEITPQTLQKLEWLGWRTLGQLLPLSRRQLEEQFGRDGAVLFRLAQGGKCRDNLRPIPSWQPPPEVSARISLELPAREPCEWNGALCEALLGVAKQLGTRRAQTLQLTVETPIGPITARRVLREAASDPKTLLAPLQSALETALQSLAPLPPVVAGFEVTLAALCTPTAQTLLFEDERETRQNRLQSALQNLESRGAEVMRLEADQSDSPFEEQWWTSVSALSTPGKKVSAHAPFSPA